MNPPSDASGLGGWAPVFGALSQASHALLVAGWLVIAAHLIRTFLRWKDEPTVSGSFRYASALLFFCVLMLTCDAAFGRPAGRTFAGVSVFAATLAAAAAYELHRISVALADLRSAREVKRLAVEVHSAANASARVTEIARAFGAETPAADPRVAGVFARDGNWQLDKSAALRELNDVLADLEAQQCKI